MFAHEQAVHSIEHAQQLSRTRFFWIVNYLADYTNFDFLWEPVPWENHQRHAWASQWQKDSGTYLVPKQGYVDTNYHTQQITMLADPNIWQNINSVEQFDFSWHPDYSDPPFNYEFGTQWQKTGGPRYPMPLAGETKYVSQSGSTSRALAEHVYIIDHMDGNTIDIKLPVVKTVRYFDNYKDTLTRIANSCDYEYIWIVSSVCDYSNFDFTWHPETWQNHMLHVFASDGEKFGDTFFMHVPTFKSKIGQFELLDWYDLNFVDISVARNPLPVIEHNYDTHVQAIQTLDWNGPLAVFATHNTSASVPCVSLWREKTKTIVPMSAGASSVIVPKTAVPYVKTQVYDYPYINKNQRHLLNDAPLDVVFISNGEVNADYNYEKLKFYVGDLNRIKRVDRVNGRVAAYHAAANASATPWFFAVFAKLEVDYLFDWLWQPDRLQEPKHYIFHARNPVNELEYGHQAMIAYNKKLVLANTGTGLDFTLDSAHEVVPILSGTANYHMDPWMCWRTAFREALKLRSATDVESTYRLRQWVKDCGPRHDYKFAKWSHIGAQDAVEYYESVGGDFAELQKSYDWAWLASYALIKHNLTPGQ